MSEELKNFLKDIHLSEASVNKLLRLSEKGVVSASDVRKIVVSEVGNRIALINEVTDKINHGMFNQVKPLPGEMKRVGNEVKESTEDNLYSKLLCVELASSASCKSGLVELSPVVDVIPDVVSKYLNSVNTFLIDLDNYEKFCSSRFNDEPTSILRKSFVKEHFKYGLVLDVLVYNNKLAKSNISQSNASLSVVEASIKLLEDELKDFDFVEKVVKPDELDLLDIVHLRGFMKYNDLKKNEKKCLIEWTYRKVMLELPILAGKFENYDPMLNHDMKLVKNRISNLRSDVNYLEVNKDVICKFDASVIESVSKYRAVLDKVKQYEL